MKSVEINRILRKRLFKYHKVRRIRSPSLTSQSFFGIDVTQRSFFEGERCMTPKMTAGQITAGLQCNGERTAFQIEW